MDRQITGMAGEFLTVGKLFKKGLQASVTLGNAKSIDVLAFNEATNRTFAVQVKTLRKKNCFLMKKDSIASDHIYVFIILGDFEEAEQYFVVEGKIILENLDHFFGTSYKEGRESPMPAINYGPLKEYKNNWTLFDK